MTLKTGTKWDKILVKESDYCYIVPRSYKEGMRVDAMIFSSPDLLEQICNDLSLEQAVNVAMLPGVVQHSLAMPDMHQGYGFPIGGVAAMDLETGVVSPGGVGFDINCGVRLLTSRLSFNTIRPRLGELVDALFEAVPAGTGSDGRIELSEKQLDDILHYGSEWCVEQGYAEAEDLEHTEEGGRIESADAAFVSKRAKQRGISQLGTLGSGNHFLELEYVEKIFDPELAEKFGLFEDQLCFMTHCGSRGLGHQVCTDYVMEMHDAMKKHHIHTPDRELSCCPIRSEEGKAYLRAMAAAANFAFANRQLISHFIRESVAAIFGADCKLDLLYDVAHNMAKFETHLVNGEEKTLLVHRKGATRAFPGGRKELAAKFQESGQPVIIPGDMGRASYVLVGTEKALELSFGSVCHGAGRLMSRTQAKKGRQAQDVIADLEKRGVLARATTRNGLTEEVPEAYKSIDDVVEAVSQAGLARKVARLRPVGVIKG